METKARNQALLCQEVESELRELCLECRKKFPIIKEYTEKAILKIRQHRDLVDQDGRSEEDLPEFPLDEVLRAILMACETFQQKIVLLSLSCLQRLIHRRVLKDDVIAIVINLMKEQATNGEEPVQIKVLQTIMATPSHMTLVSELVLGQLMELLYVLHNSASAAVHHTACAGLGQLVEKMADRAVAEVKREASAIELEAIHPVIRRHPASSMPTVQPGPAPLALTGPLRMFYVFVQDLCVMADYDATNLSTRYAVDAGERMRTGWREGFWLNTIKFPRPLCLELLGTCVAAHPTIFTGTKECFALLRHNLCATLLKNLRGCFDFAILIRSIHLLQQLMKTPGLATLLMPEMQVFLHLMLDLTSDQRSPWQRATSLEFLKSICEDPKALAVLYEKGASPTSRDIAASPSASVEGPRTFLDLVNALSKLIHQVCFSSGMDSASLLNSAAAAGGTSTAGGSSASGTSGPAATSASASMKASASMGGAGGGATDRQTSTNFGDLGRGLMLLGGVNLPQLFLGGNLSSFGLGGAPVAGAGGALGSCGARDIFAAGGGASGDGTGSGSTFSSTTGFGGGGGGGGGQQGRSGSSASKAQKLLLLMNETEPPVVQPMLLIQLLIDSVMSIVISLYRLLIDCDDTSASGSSGGHFEVGRCVPLKAPLSPGQERCKGMITECWSSLLSALSLLLHFSNDEAYLTGTLTCLQTLLFCCSRLTLDQAREACMNQLSKYAAPSPGYEAELDDGRPGGAGSGGGLTPKNVLCIKALMHFCYRYGGLLGTGGWRIALRAFNTLERSMQKAQPSQGLEANLRSVLDSVFETTALLPEEALLQVVDAMAQHMRGVSDVEEGNILLNRLVEVCSYNLSRLLVMWDRVLRIVTDVCIAEDRGELRGAAAAALCRILAQALKKGALAMAEHPEAAQEELLRHLEVLLRVPHEDARARVCEGLLGILQASGQELHPAAWGTMIHLVAMAARVELERVGFQFALPNELDPMMASAANLRDASDIVAEGSLPPMHHVGSTANARDASEVLPTVFQLLELLVQDFMEYAPPDSVPLITASIGAFARFGALGVNSSLTAVGFLWNVADALARYHCPTPGSVAGGPGAPDDAAAIARADEGGGGSKRALKFEELWVQIFMHLRVLAVDGRPEVRNTAVKSLTSALLSHGRKIGTACYQRCLRDILIEVVAEIQSAANDARNGVQRAGSSKAEGLIIHHSRDTPEKQWNETMVLAVEGVRRVLSHFSEEAGVRAFAPLAYTVLLQVQTTLICLSSELSGSALRSLVDLMRIPASCQPFEASALGAGCSPELPIDVADAAATTSIWLLGWHVLWGLAKHCLSREVPESLMETFEKTLTSLRNTHRHLFTTTQHLIVLHVSLVLTTSPSFYLSTSVPLFESGTLQPSKEDVGSSVDHVGLLKESVRLCMEEAASAAVLMPMDREVFEFTSSAPEALWRLESRVECCAGSRTYTKKPTEVSSFVDANPSKNLDIRSMEFALRDVIQQVSATDEATQAFLGPGRSPTHRTMLHISSSRLQHVQGFVFGLLEDTQGFPEPGLEVLFLLQCCAMFLDVDRVLQDTNKVALAARTLCLLVLFCRRVLLLHLSRLARPGADPGEMAQEAAHLEVLLGQAVPHLCRVVTALVRARGRPGLRQSGLGKLAFEALIYLIEDSLPAVERCALGSDTLASYWEAVSSSLAGAVASLPAPPEPKAGKPAAAAAPTPAERADADLLTQAAGNLVAHRVLSCAVAPAEVLEGAVRLLEALADLQSRLTQAGLRPLGPASPAGGPKQATRARGDALTPGPGVALMPKQAPVADSGAVAGAASAESGVVERTNLGHLFDLCDARLEEEGCLSPGGPEEDCNCYSVAAFSARGGLALRPPRAFPDRSALLGIAVPALLKRVRAVFAAYTAEEEGRSTCEVCFVLARLAALRADEAAAAAAAPKGPSRARAACELAGLQGLAMTLLPQLSALVTSPDGRVRRGVRTILEGLSTELGL